MEIRQFTWDVIDSNSWLLLTREALIGEVDANHQTTHGLLIDAVDNKELYEVIPSLASLTIILTHSHFDHIIGLNRIRELRPDSIVISTSRCSENLSNVHRNLSLISNAFLSFYQDGAKRNVVIEPFNCKPVDKTFTEKEKCFCWHEHDVRLFSVYGHSEDGLLVLFDGKLLFSGDTLLSTPIVTCFPGGSKKRYFEEDIPLINRIISLNNRDNNKYNNSNGWTDNVNDKLKICPGHGNPFYRSGVSITKKDMEKI